MSEKLTIKNVVGGGAIGTEIDLHSVSTAEFEKFDIQYEPESYAAIVLRSHEFDPTIMLFRSGKFSIAGGKSVQETNLTFQRFCDELESITGLEIEPSIEIRFFVTTGNLERPLDLSTAAVSLGLDETEYEPEQFPGLFYRPKNRDWFAILFASGSVVIDGDPDLEVLEDAYDEIDDTLKNNGI
ncbi:hypothetical protein [Haloarchaeobius amylolyticus]|uniref:hypothetical protein n=1 Tax=Haloarchaeobius amylolyticus TaxID=1198296 RepID=UPI00226FB4B1|nr:hypothetical protein [Haloarchaeobius amylolyticus]